MSLLLGFQVPFPPEVIPHGAIVIAQSFFMMVAAIALGVPIIRAISRRWERGSPTMPTMPPDLTNRLDRIEQAVDTVALEVERMTEAQRFIAKLMAERALPAGESPAKDAKSAGSEPSRRPDSAR